jgi:hypothetical protein
MLCLCYKTCSNMVFGLAFLAKVPPIQPLNLKQSGHLGCGN